MSSSKTTFISVSNQKRWITEVDNAFSKEAHVVDMYFEYPTCVFRVPKSLGETKPEAYAPVYLGLGPYHHLRPEFYVMQKHKISAVKKFLPGENIQVFNQVVATLIKSEPVVRACYDQYLDFHIETLARILAIDGLYLLQLFKERKSIEKLAGDLTMLENQIPVVLLQKIGHVLTFNKICEPPAPRDDHVLSQEFQDFCLNHSPLELGTDFPMIRRELHLLHLMYYLILWNREEMSMGVDMTTESQEFTEDVSTCLEIFGLPGAGLPGQILAIVERVKRISARFRKQETPSIEKIVIPAVSAMAETAGIEFECTHDGIRDIRYEGDEKKLHLPSIRLDANYSEVILRNLLAFEEAAAATTKTVPTRELASYIELMCGIINTAMDVKILKTAKIITGKLSDEEIVCIFNGIRKSTGKNNVEQQSYIKKAIDGVNMRYNDMASVKVKRFLNKYFNASWKVLTTVVAVAVVLVLVLQALCSVLGCARWLEKRVTVQGFNNMSAYKMI